MDGVARSSLVGRAAWLADDLSATPALKRIKRKDQMSSVSDARTESEAFDRMTVRQWRVLLRDDKPGARKRTVPLLSFGTHVWI